MIHHAKRFVLLGVVFITAAPLNAACAAPSHVTVDVKKKPADTKWVQRDTRTLETLADFTPGNAVELDQYGGRADLHIEATGFFHPRKVGDR